MTGDELDRLLAYLVDTIYTLEVHGNSTPASAARTDDVRKLAQVVFQLVRWLKYDRLP